VSGAPTAKAAFGKVLISEKLHQRRVEGFLYLLMFEIVTSTRTAAFGKVLISEKLHQRRVYGFCISY